MKLATLKVNDAERAVLVHGSNGQEKFIDIQTLAPSCPSDLKSLLAADDYLSSLNAAIQNVTPETAGIEGELRPPIPQPQKILCIGLNYRDHAEETGAKLPDEPVVFGKFGNTLVPHEAAVPLPKVSQQVDYEAELVVVIGKTCKHASVDNALQCVGGYTIGHDVSARDWQKGRPAGQWLLGKSPDGFAPCGPYLITADEIPDPQSLSVKLTLNGELLQDGHTSQMIFSVAEIIAHISQIMTLVPGDLIFTGTPAGVGIARDPHVLLKPGDVTEVEIEKLGVLRNTFIAEA